MNTKYTFFRENDSKIVVRNDDRPFFLDVGMDGLDNVMFEMNRYSATSCDEFLDELRRGVESKNRISHLELIDRDIYITTIMFDEYDSNTSEFVIHLDNKLVTDEAFMTRLTDIIAEYNMSKEEVEGNFDSEKNNMLHRQQVKSIAQTMLKYYNEYGLLLEIDLDIVEEVYAVLQKDGQELAKTEVKPVMSPSARDSRRFVGCSIAGSTTTTLLYGLIKGNLEDTLACAAGAFSVTAVVSVANLVISRRERRKKVNELIANMKARYGLDENGKIIMNNSDPDAIEYSDGPTLTL